MTGMYFFMKQYGADDKVLLKETTEFLIRVVVFFFLDDCLFVFMLYTPVNIFSYVGTLLWLNL